MITNKIMKGMTVAFSLLALQSVPVSCSDDWDDHYDEPAGNGVSLWQTIKQTPELSNFQRLLDHCGYASALDGQQMFTVFAPVNSNFTTVQADSVIALYDQQQQAGVKQKDNAAIKEFVMNHLALYNHSIYGGINDTITLINGKRQALTDNIIGKRHLLSSNVRAGNGVLFTTDGELPYQPNVMEYLTRDGQLDSIALFYNSRNRQVFLPEQSVAGSVVDGQTVYLDSVFALRNELFQTIAPINAEDSTYWVLVPTDDEWTRLAKEYEQYYVFDKTVNGNDSLQRAYARNAIVRGTVFSRTLNPDNRLQNNAWSTNASDHNGTYMQDGQEYHYFQYPTKGGELFSNAERVECSNGQVLKTGHWPITIYQTIAQGIAMEAENPSSFKEVDTKTTRYPLTEVTVQPSSAFFNKVSGNKYVEILPKSPSVRPSATFNLPNILSNVGYDIYVVTAPALAGDSLATAEQCLPTKFRVTVYWNDVNGSQHDEILNEKKDFITTVNAVDVFKVAENKSFPTCSYGQKPQVALKVESRVSNSEQAKGTYQRTIRIDRIVAVPHQEK